MKSFRTNAKKKRVAQPFADFTNQLRIDGKKWLYTNVLSNEEYR